MKSFLLSKLWRAGSIIIFVLSACTTQAPQTPTSPPTLVPPSPEPINTADPETLNEDLVSNAEADDLSEVERLLEAGADVDHIYEDFTALVHAAINGNNDMLSVLLQSGADVSIRGKFGNTALMRAAQAGHLETTQLLLDASQDLDIIEDISIALIRVAERGHTDVAALLIDQGPDLQMKELEFTALIRAAENEHSDIVKLLVDAGADLDATENTESTALMYAAFNGDLESVRHLVEAGANVNLRDNINATALTWAINDGNPEIIALIEAAGGVE